MTANNNEFEKTACEACGKGFSCGAESENCWCFEVQMKPEILLNLQKKYKNCLCSNCLTNKIELLLADQAPAENCN